MFLRVSIIKGLNLVPPTGNGKKGNKRQVGIRIIWSYWVVGVLYLTLNEKILMTTQTELSKYTTVDYCEHRFLSLNGLSTVWSHSHIVSVTCFLKGVWSVSVDRIRLFLGRHNLRTRLTPLSGFVGRQERCEDEVPLYVFLITLLFLFILSFV